LVTANNAAMTVFVVGVISAAAYTSDTAVIGIQRSKGTNTK
jgi:hypothetical protein